MKKPFSTGRSLFSKYRTVILMIAYVFRLFPHSLLIYLWRITDIFPNTLGICLRYCILKVLAKECGDNVLIGPYVEIRAWENLSLGENVSIHRNSYIDATGNITIGSNVSIAHSTSILSFDHTWADHDVPIKYNPITTAHVIIDDDIWIGCGCRVLAGVHIGKRSIVAAGAVVINDVESMTLVAGVPAKKIKMLV
jgi:acetyltransferase-like isoleucine patch superfamily enzyme